MGLIALPQVREMLNRARVDADPRLDPLPLTTLTSYLSRGQAGLRDLVVRRIDGDRPYDEDGATWLLDERRARRWAQERAKEAAERLQRREGPPPVG